MQQNNNYNDLPLLAGYKSNNETDCFGFRFGEIFATNFQATNDNRTPYKQIR